MTPPGAKAKVAHSAYALVIPVRRWAHVKCFAIKNPPASGAETGGTFG